MKYKGRWLLVGGCAMVLCVVAVAQGWTPAQAQLGTSGVQVHCSVYAAGTAQTLACHAADGTVFTNNRVPAGYYLHITDVSILPDLADPSVIVIQAEDAGNQNQDGYALHTASFAPLAQHFTTPVLVLAAQYRLQAYSNNGDSFIADVWGLLTHTLLYTPVVAR